MTRLIFNVLEPRERIRLLLVFVMVATGALLETLSISIVIPVVQAVLGTDTRKDHPWIPAWIDQLPFIQFVQLLMAVLVLAFLFKNLFVFGSIYIQQRFQFAIVNRISQRLFETYLRQPFEFHLQTPSSILVRNIEEYPRAFVSQGVTPIIAVLSDLTTGVGLLIILILVNPMATTVFVGTFGLCGYLITSVSRGRAQRWGAERIKHRGVILDMLLAGLGGVKEIQLFGRATLVVDTHRKSLHEAARSGYMFQLLQNSPRAFFEVAAVGGVALLIIGASIQRESFKDVAVVIALFGVVAFRMLPAVNRVIQANQQMRYGRTAIVAAVDDMSLPVLAAVSRHEARTDAFQRVELRDLRYAYPKSDVVVSDIKFLSVLAGESLGIIGKSGSGKSTFVDLILGILTPTSGTVVVNGKNIADDPRYWQDRIGYVPQHVYLMDTTVRRNVAFGLPEKVISDADVEKALRLANLWDFVQTLPKGLNTEVGERGVRLSGGQRQRLGIARALYGNPEVIVLDEATSALDSETEREIVESFREIANERTLIVVAHRTSTLAHCSRLIRLENGRIVQDGTYEDVIGSLSAS